MQKKKNDHPRTTPSLMCFFLAAKNVLRPKRETKGLHGSCKIPFISDQKNKLPKALPSIFVGFHANFEFLQILNYFLGLEVGRVPSPS